jgi:large subunit ribosomal protein L10
MREGYNTCISDKKKEDVKSFSLLMKEYPIIGIVNMQNLPCQQLNTMRQKLREKGVTIKMCKKRLLKIAIEKSETEKKGLKELENHIKGMPAVIFTRENPFSLFKLIKKNKSKAPAKEGQVAPNDITVKAGPTNFMPGPIISELSAFKIKSKVEEGKIAIIEDATVAKEGEVIDSKLASMLLRLGITPMEIGLDLVAIYENGTIFTKSVLDIDEVGFKKNLDNCARWAFNLSIEATYPTSSNISTIIAKAYRQAKGVATETDIICSETIKDMVIKANNQMLSVKSALGI